MDTFFETWSLISDHVQANLKAYILGCVLAVPFIYFTRKWTVPLILYTIEISIYLAIMHLVVHVVVGLTAWFKTNSSMRALRPDGVPVDAVYWTTPLVNFWEKKIYDPQWIIYVESGFIVLVIILVLKFRPMHVQKPKPRFGVDGSKKAESDQNAQTVANRYGRRRYADEWAKDAVTSARNSRVRKQSGK
jgi:uncharacterized integral membrane protein